MRGLAFPACVFVLLPATYAGCSSDSSGPSGGASGATDSEAGAESTGSSGNPASGGNANSGGSGPGDAGHAPVVQGGTPSTGQAGETSAAGEPALGGAPAQSGGDGGSGGEPGGKPKQCATDCSELTLGCDVGECNTTSGECETTVLGDNEPCEDRNPCTAGTTCSAGECVSSSTACDLPTGIGVSVGGNASLIGYHTGDFSDTCGDGQALVGFHGSYTTSTSGTLTYITGISGICADIALEWSVEQEAYVAVTDQTEPLTFRGYDVFADFDRMCPPGEVVVGLHGSGYGGGAVTRFFVHCAPLTVVWNTGWEVALGAEHALTSPFLSLQVDTYTGMCPENQVAVGVYGGYNPQFVQDITGGIGVICGASAPTWP